MPSFKNSLEIVFSKINLEQKAQSAEIISSDLPIYSCLACLAFLFLWGGVVGGWGGEEEGVANHEYH